MSILSDLLHLAAEHLPVWRDAAVLVLAGIVIGALYVYASLVDVA